MLPSLWSFRAALLIGWTLLGVAAWVFAGSLHVAWPLAVPLGLAFLTEYIFYLAPGFSAVRERIARRFTRSQIACLIAGSSLLPYLVYTVPTGRFAVAGFTALSGISVAVAFWFVLFGAVGGWAPARDLLFLALLAVVILSGILRFIYPAPLPKLPLDVLGHVTLIRSAILSVLLLRGAESPDFGFVPRWREIRIGFVWFLAFVAAALPLAWALGQLRLPPRSPHFWPAIGLVLGIFWIVALSEEFFFRALLQQWLTVWMRSGLAGLLAASLLFGACHLWRGLFPNWRFALLASVSGLFYGAAFRQAHSMRASMVTHALAVSTWRLFFT